MDYKKEYDSRHLLKFLPLELRIKLFKNVTENSRFFEELQLNQKDLAFFLPYMEKKMYKVDDFLDFQGRIQYYIYIIYKGDLRAISEVQVGKQHEIMQFHKGDCVGLCALEPGLGLGVADEDSIYQDVQWPFFVQAVSEPCIVFRVEVQHFLTFFPKGSPKRRILDEQCKKE